MKTYPAGDITKEKIYQASKAVFYKDGYKKAAMKEVSQLADIKQSVFYYHYKNKAELAKKLYNEFGTAHATAIMERLLQMGCRDDIILSTCVCSALLMINSVETPNIGRFWAEMYTDNLTADIPFHRHFHELIYKKNVKDYSQTDFEVFLVGRSSINCGLMLAYLDGRLDITPAQLAAYKTIDTLRALHFPEDAAKKITRRVLETAEAVPIHCGENFKIYCDDTLIF